MFSSKRNPFLDRIAKQMFKQLIKITDLEGKNDSELEIIERNILTNFILKLI